MKLFQLIIVKFVFLFIVIFINLIHPSNQLYADKNKCQNIISLIDEGSINIADENGQTLCKFNENIQYIPASIIKILTAKIAIDYLGKDYKFSTNFWITRENELIIEGFGDPFLISEEIILIAKQLKILGLNEIKQILVYLDNFEEIIIPGVTDSNQPYDAPNGSLLVNFNTVFAEYKNNGIIISAEPQTPLTAIAKNRALELLTKGEKNRFNLGKKYAVIYSVQLFKEILSKNAIVIKNNNYKKIDSIPKSSRLIYKHKNSRTLVENLIASLKYSNNMQANQIFLTIGAKMFGYPATIKKSQKAIVELINNLKIKNKEYILFIEGSGISNENKITSQYLIEVLNIFKDQANLLPNKDGHYIKSGTLTGVYNYAGYIKTDNGLRSFVIILNQKKNNRNKILNEIINFK